MNTCNLCGAKYKDPKKWFDTNLVCSKCFGRLVSRRKHDNWRLLHPFGRSKKKT
jgi:hypothetical protein